VLTPFSAVRSGYHWFDLAKAPSATSAGGFFVLKRSKASAFSRFGWNFGFQGLPQSITMAGARLDHQ
jgi:hypothetical protein